MKVRDFAACMGMEVYTGDAGMNRDISGIYICDLLSWTMSHAAKGDGWITVHTHLNIVAVAVLAEIACIIIPEGIKAEEAAIQKAVQEGVPILGTNLTAYEVCCRASKLIQNKE